MIKNIIFYLLFFCSLTSKSQTWDSLGFGANFNVECFIVDSNDKLYVGGLFTEVDGVQRTSIAVWDSSQWSSFGNNAIFNGGILCMSIFNGDLVVGGSFDSINNIPVNHIARWDGNNWQPIGAGFNKNVYTIVEYGSKLYAGGNFFISGLDTTRYFAKWNGVSWENAARNIDGYVFTSTVLNNKLVIGGQFTNINGSLSIGVAALDDTTWTNLGIRLNNQVLRVKNIEDTLYVCGNFTQYPGNPINYICKYDGSTWTQLPYPVSSTQTITDIVKYNHRLYVCGDFDNPDDLGRINGLAYDSVGGSNGFYVCMIAYKNQLYVGGNFTLIGGTIQSICISRYTDDLFSGVIELEEEITYPYPNPVIKSSISKIKYKDLEPSNIKTLSLFNVEGTLLWNSLTGFENIPINEFAEGFYIAILTTKNGQIYKDKIIVIK